MYIKKLLEARDELQKKEALLNTALKVSLFLANFLECVACSILATERSLADCEYHTGRGMSSLSRSGTHLSCATCSRHIRQGRGGCCGSAWVWHCAGGSPWPCGMFWGGMGVTFKQASHSLPVRPLVLISMLLFDTGQQCDSTSRTWPRRYRRGRVRQSGCLFAPRSHWHRVCPTGKTETSVGGRRLANIAAEADGT